MYFTKVNGVCYGPEGQGGEPQIEVTQEMIDAGVAALSCYVSYEATDTHVETIARAVYMAMASPVSKRTRRLTRTTK